MSCRAVPGRKRMLPPEFPSTVRYRTPGDAVSGQGPGPAHRDGCGNRVPYARKLREVGCRVNPAPPATPPRGAGDAAPASVVSQK